MGVTDKYANAHAHPSGPGDARPTAMQIIEDEGVMGKLTGRVFLITGASSGIGVETARALHAAGADLYLPVRNAKKGRKVVDDIRESNSKYDHAGKIVLLDMDSSSLKSVRACAEEFLQQSNTLNVLINNAGIMACPESTTEDGFESQFGVNHLAHFLLFQLLKSTLLSSSTPEFPSRVVNLTSVGHRSSPVQLDDLDFSKGGYNPWKAYGQAKTANIWMANEIERRYGSQGLHATSVMPGGIMTGLQEHVDQAMMDKWEQPEIKKHMKDTAQGAATTVWAAIGQEWANKGGAYLDNCSEPGPAPPPDKRSMFDSGEAEWAKDEEAAKKLWAVSLDMVGLSQDD